MLNKAISIFMLLFMSQAIARTDKCPLQKDEPKESDINLCIYNSINNYQSSNARITHNEYISIVKEVLVNYFDKDRSGSIDYLELKKLTLFKPKNGELKADLYGMGMDLYLFCKKNNPIIFKEYGFELDINNNIYPDKDVFIYALPAKVNILKSLSAKIKYSKNEILAGNRILGLESVSEEFWNQYFDVGVKNKDSFIKQKSIVSKYKQIVKTDKKKIEEKASTQKPIIRGEKFGSDNKWEKIFSVGDKFEDRFTKDFANPAKLLFEKSLGEETKESLNLAFRFDIKNISEGENKHWRYSVGHSIEKATKKGESKDIRGYHYSQDKTYDSGNVQLSLSALDNFVGGNESWVGKISYSPKHKDKNQIESNKALKDNCNFSKNSNTWLNFPRSNCDEIILNKWQFFYTPFIEIEKNELTQKPTDPTVLFNDDADYVIFRLETGLKKGQFEFKYSGTRRFNIDGAKHLSYQEISTDFYFDKKKHFSIGITAKIGQRPIDLKRVEDYELGFGFSL